MADFQDVADGASLPPGGQLRTRLGGVTLLLCREGDQVWALKNSCPHAFQPLDGGVVRAGTIQCPKHGACFDLASGRSLNQVTDRPVSVYPARLVGGRIQVALPPGAV